MKYNRSEIMKEAWKIYRGMSRNLRGEIMGTFATALHLAWISAKRASTQTMESAKRELFILQMKDIWDDTDRAEARRLKQIIGAAA